MESHNLRELSTWFSWDELFRKDWTQNNVNKSIILLLLSGFYLSSRKIVNAPGAILFINLYFNNPNPKLFENINKSNLFENHKELVDAMAIEYLCMGFLCSSKDNPEQKIRRAVNIMSADNIKQKLYFSIFGALLLKNFLKEHPALADRNFDFIPGVLILVGGKNNIIKEPEIINISDWINQIEESMSQSIKAQLLVYNKLVN